MYKGKGGGGEGAGRHDKWGATASNMLDGGGGGIVPSGRMHKEGNVQVGGLKEGVEVRGVYRRGGDGTNSVTE